MPSDSACASTPLLLAAADLSPISQPGPVAQSSASSGSIWLAAPRMPSSMPMSSSRCMASVEGEPGEDDHRRARHRGGFHSHLADGNRHVVVRRSLVVREPVFEDEAGRRLDLPDPPVALGLVAIRAGHVVADGPAGTQVVIDHRHRIRGRSPPPFELAGGPPTAANLSCPPTVSSGCRRVWKKGSS